MHENTVWEKCRVTERQYHSVPFKISVWKSAIFTEVMYGFPQSLYKKYRGEYHKLGRDGVFPHNFYLIIN
jgi:hypothetical protein